MAYARRKETPRGPGRGPDPEPATGALSEFPTLVGFIRETTFDDGSERETGTVLMCVGDGVCRLWLNDRAAGQSAWVSATTLHGALAAAEEGLFADVLDWRQNRPSAARRR